MSVNTCHSTHKIGLMIREGLARQSLGLHTELNTTKQSNITIKELFKLRAKTHKMLNPNKVTNT